MILARWLLALAPSTQVEPTARHTSRLTKSPSLTHLCDLQQIYRGIASRADGPRARIVINVANLRSTRLAWDVGAALSEILIFDREVVLHWDNPQDWFIQDYCRIFRAPAGHCRARGSSAQDQREQLVKD